MSSVLAYPAAAIEPWDARVATFLRAVISSIRPVSCEHLDGTVPTLKERPDKL
jgi:hypothetical protein